MMKRLLLCVLLAGVVTGCRTFGTRPTPPEPPPTPQAPPVSPLPMGGSLPPGASHIVGTVCPDTGTYTLVGVNTQARSFAYVVKGDRATRDTALSGAYKAGVPVVLYTSPVKVLGSKGAAGSAAVTSGVTASQTETGSMGTGVILDPCDVDWEIGEKPPEPDKDVGGARASDPQTLYDLAWSSANAIDGITDPAPRTSTRPPPTGGSTVPR